MSVCDYTISKVLDKIVHILETNIPPINTTELTELKVLINQFKEEMYRQMPDHR